MSTFVMTKSMPRKLTPEEDAEVLAYLKANPEADIEQV